MKRISFPHEIRRGATTVKVYRVRHRKTKDGFVYTVASYHGGVRKTRQFTSVKKALAEAALVCSQINAGKLKVAEGMTSDDVGVLAAARELCGTRPILSVLEEHQRACDLVGNDLMEACRSWAAKNAGGVKQVLYPQVVKRFTRAKQRAGIKGEGYKKVLPRTIKHFENRSIGSLTANELDAMIHREFATPGNDLAHPSSYNSARKKLVSMFRWARKQGLLPAERQTEPERLDTARESETTPEIIHVADLARVLQFASTEETDLLGVIILAAFTGLRRAEIHAQTWEDIDLKRALLRVTAGKQGTPARRLVRLSDAAIQWLMKCGEKKGRLSPTNYGFDAARRAIKETGIDLPQNCFRHAWISHRVARDQDIAATSLEAGNSPDIIRKHYLELVAKEDGEQWFSLSPELITKIDGKVVQYG